MSGCMMQHECADCAKGPREPGTDLPKYDPHHEGLLTEMALHVRHHDRHPTLI